MRSYLFPIWLVLTCLPGAIQAQDLPRPLPTYSYVNGQIQGQLPYGKEFFISGNTLQPGTAQRANVVELAIYEEVYRTQRIRRERRIFFKPDSLTLYFGTSPIYQSFWWDSEDTDPANFKVYVGRPLKVNTYYQVVLNFYHKYQLDDATTKRLIETVKLRIAGQNNLSVRIENVEDVLNDVVAEYAQEVNFGYLEPTRNDRVRFDTTRKRLELPVTGELPYNLQLELGRIIQHEQILADANFKLESKINELKLFARSDTFMDLERRLNAALREDDSVTYRLSDVQALRNFLVTGNTNYDPFPPLLRYVESSSGSRRLTELDKMILRALPGNYFRPIQNLTMNRDRLLDKIELMNEQVSDAGLDQLIGEGFVQANSAELIETPYAKLPESASDGTNRRQSFAVGENSDLVPSTGYDAINIGTAYGVGLVGLNFPDPTTLGSNDPFALTEPALVSYIGVKFYFSQVDKAFFIEEPYPLFRDRLSLMVGVKATGDLNYRGNSLGKVLAVQPVTGLSVDINRVMSLDAGFVLFGEPSLSPFLDRNRLRVAPFIGLSLDANVFNATRNLITGNSLYPGS